MRWLITLVAIILASSGVPMKGEVMVFTSPNYAFFFTPHQDDEVLSMGASIVEHVQAGRTVYVVLMTDGGASQYCIPTYGSRAACVVERDKEFTDGVNAMGAIPIIRSDRMADGTLTVAYAASVINRYYLNYPNASFKTMSEFDASPDHANLGKGMKSLNIVDSRYYIKHSEWATHNGTFTAQYDMNTTLDLYPFGHISVPSDFAASTYPTGNFSKYYHY